MIHEVKFSRFWRLSLGLLLLGIGQRLLYTGAISPWARDRGLPIFLIVLSLVALGLGMALIFPLIIWFYKRHRSDKRLPQLILAYLLSAVVAGLFIGGIGQLLYDHTSFAYYAVRTGVWTTSTIIQSILKLLLCFGLVSIHKNLPIRKRSNYLYLPLVGVFLASIGIVLLNYFLPTIGSIVTSLIDAIVLISTLYYFIYLVKETPYETTS
ncbi:hypothetical protein [Streptococcus suis]|uniref:Uncharacterized protein n=2 Tax=Streptococcus suis TaxID=1307 RepID=A0A0Z8H867_STRSU|nr:hypothetical protein [Streptococcus suis]NQH00387.1 hypothetical protein [Streptococcus suis]NQH27855.1 hypothetical protein [Streptococcus suis]NQH31515.1 hypothetical protein [Streptococcus suis]NQH48990.1 hypothetical protein [Streptococcus suis]NQH54323.1 hypothetical protein [Streptococcus suis]